jgi:signal peptidase I
MSKAPSSNGDSPAVLNGGDPERVADRPRHEVGAAPERNVRGVAGPPTKRRTGQAHDYRFGSLRIGSTDDALATPRSNLRHRYHRPLLATAAGFVVVAAIAVLLIQGFVIQPYSVRGDAMTPTLQSGDRMLVLKPSLLRGTIQSGDIVVVHASKSLRCSVAGGSTGDLVLRVAAVPGNVISSVGDSILVDGRRLSERGRYDPRFGEIGSTPIRKTTLSAGRYFVLADNRSNACDSRTFGPIPKSSIAGEGIAIVGRAGHVSFGTL